MNRSSRSVVLIAEEDVSFLRLLQDQLDLWGFRSVSSTTKEAFVRSLERDQPDLILLEIGFATNFVSGVLRQFRSSPTSPPFIILAASGSIEEAISSIRMGAFDYFPKPLDLNRLRLAMNKMAQEGRRESEIGGTIPEQNLQKPGPLLGHSAAIQKLKREVAEVAASDAPVLILGESGSGKELVARTIHTLSSRRHGSFVALNLVAQPAEVIDITLGIRECHQPSGPHGSRRENSRPIHGGTLFLDEIGEMEPALQSRLLRFLQDQSDNRARASWNVRIIAATNKNPLEQIRQGHLREDLYYRLNVVPIVVPPLRDRCEDIPQLATHFLGLAIARLGKEALELEDDAVKAMSAYSWPGNVRQLENVMERLAILTSGGSIRSERVSQELIESLALTARAPQNGVAIDGSKNDADPGLCLINRMEKQAIIEALEHSRGKVKIAAERLGLGQATVYRKMKRYGIPMS